MLDNNDTASAIQVFKLNTKEFPESSNVWNSLGEAYMKAGDMDMAKVNYEKAVLLDPNDENSKKKLEKIKQSLQK